MAREKINLKGLPASPAGAVNKFSIRGICDQTPRNFRKQKAKEQSGIRSDEQGW